MANPRKDFTDEVRDFMLVKLDECCAYMNDKYPDSLFYVQESENAIYLDCSDYSPVNVKIFTIY